jgi:hypothetical protein
MSGSNPPASSLGERLLTRLPLGLLAAELGFFGGSLGVEGQQTIDDLFLERLAGCMLSGRDGVGVGRDLDVGSTVGSEHGAVHLEVELEDALVGDFGVF